MNLPNKLTILRIILAAVFTCLLSWYFPYSKTLALLIFIIASITDIYDGKIARETGIVTNFGKLMDPLADKILISAAFIMFIKLEPISLPSWMVIIIIAREFLITGIRLIAASESKVIPSDNLGKTKTISQVTTVIIILIFLSVREVCFYHFNFWEKSYDLNFHNLALVMLTLTIILTVHSGLNYLLKNKELLKE